MSGDNRRTESQASLSTLNETRPTSDVDFDSGDHAIEETGRQTEGGSYTKPHK